MEKPETLAVPAIAQKAPSVPPPEMQTATYRLAYATAQKVGDPGVIAFTFAKTRLRIAKEMHDRINDPRGFVSVHLTQGVYVVEASKILENKDLAEAQAIEDARNDIAVTLEADADIIRQAREMAMQDEE